MVSNLWEEIINPKTGQSSLQQHEVKILNVGCKPKDHCFKLAGGSTREAVCQHCKIVSGFVLGYHTIKDGKIVKRL
jgi:nitrogenase subunit NifH